MDFIDRLRELGSRVETVRERCQTEQGTKNALVMPFLVALGYDVFNPVEVVPEFTADVATKKGEKVDYAIMRDGQPILLIECKTLGDKGLDPKHASQLYRYFTVTKAKFALLTDGAFYRFFTDLEAQNLMDSRPFLEFDIRDLDERTVDEIKKFTKENFDIDTIKSTASVLKYVRGIQRILGEEFANPSEEFVRILTQRVYEGRFTQGVRDEFAPIVRRAFQEFIGEMLNRRLQTALDSSTTTFIRSTADEVATEATPEPVATIITTPEEIEAFYVVKSIIRDIVDPSRVFMRDTQSYCSVLLDDNNRKPICRLFFNSAQKYVGLMDDAKQVTRYPLESLNSLYKFSDQLRAAASRYARVTNAELDARGQDGPRATTAEPAPDLTA
ncbi:MAG TPA: type I restriction endonuclease [Pirellulaceae bacterium]|jgi:hypothetical protein|nr:type I restriction endonuclease [Pirellulaceae bacterium]